jgi:SWI/SNF-related matrix-associated actin-dependent regulator of chromatin subfamily D
MSNICANQSLEEGLNPLEADQAPCWTFKIEGRLLDNTKGKPVEQQPKFTSFFKSIVIEVQRENDLFPQGNLIQVCTSSYSGKTLPQHQKWTDWK